MTASPHVAVCPGSFDPIHRGHEEIIRRAARLFDVVIVGVGANPSKSRWFTDQERLDLCSEVFADADGVEVQTFSGLVTDFCRDVGACALVKGLRNGADLDYETPMARMNQALTGVETVFLDAAPAWSFVSSSLVKEVLSLGGDVAPFLSPVVHEALLRRSKQR